MMTTYFPAVFVTITCFFVCQLHAKEEVYPGMCRTQQPVPFNGLGGFLIP